jgi:serine/threonine-protein kinase RsbT
MAQVIDVFDDSHAVLAALWGQCLAQRTGFPERDCVAVGTAILEVARNIVRYAGRGTVSIAIVQDGERVGMQVSAIDNGPGIADLTAALRDGYSTGGGLGCGLPGAKRLMDQFEITSQPGAGTSITMTRWKP